MTTSKPEGVSWWQYARKAGIAALAGTVALLGALAGFAMDGSAGDSQIVTAEWLTAAYLAVVAVAGTFGVYQATNRVRG